MNDVMMAGCNESDDEETVAMAFSSAYGDWYFWDPDPIPAHYSNWWWFNESFYGAPTVCVEPQTPQEIGGCYDTPYPARYAIQGYGTATWHVTTGEHLPNSNCIH